MEKEKQVGHVDWAEYCGIKCSYFKFLFLKVGSYTLDFSQEGKWSSNNLVLIFSASGWRKQEEF